MVDMERIYTIPLRDVKQLPRTKRAPRAIAVVKKFVARHMKTTEEDVWIDTHVNELLWARGIEKPPSKIRVKAVKFEDQEIVEVSLPEE
jgi:large subunit ribosomal protein L31e